MSFSKSKRKITSDGMTRADLIRIKKRDSYRSKKARVLISKLHTNRVICTISISNKFSIVNIDYDIPRQGQSISNLPEYYDTVEVHQIWKDCITYAIEFTDPIFCHTHDIYMQTMNMLRSKICKQKQSTEKGQFLYLAINFETFDNSPYHKQKELAAAYAHEIRMYQKTHKRCFKCQGVSIITDYKHIRDNAGKYHCDQCRRLDTDHFWKYKNDMLLPVWFNEHKEVQFHIPEELNILRLGEKLLIQRLSCFVPIVHIKNGIMGIHGHCVSFRQDIIEICNVLPRSRVNAIKIIKGYKASDSTMIQDFDIFTIRRNVVMKALIWLKKHHKWYREDPDLVIDESSLNWMGDKESASLIGTDAITSNIYENKEFDTLQREIDDEDDCGR